MSVLSRGCSVSHSLNLGCMRHTWVMSYRCVATTLSPWTLPQNIMCGTNAPVTDHLNRYRRMINSESVFLRTYQWFINSEKTCSCGYIMAARWASNSALRHFCLLQPGFLDLNRLNQVTSHIRLHTPVGGTYCPIVPDCTLGCITK